jgi:hypothetical protein
MGTENIAQASAEAIEYAAAREQVEDTRPIADAAAKHVENEIHAMILPALRAIVCDDCMKIRSLRLLKTNKNPRRISPAGGSPEHSAYFSTLQRKGPVTFVTDPDSLGGRQMRPRRRCLT